MTSPRWVTGAWATFCKSKDRCLVATQDPRPCPFPLRTSRWPPRRMRAGGVDEQPHVASRAHPWQRGLCIAASHEFAIILQQKCGCFRMHRRAYCGDRLQTGLSGSRNDDLNQYWRCQPPSAATKDKIGKLCCEPAIFPQARIPLSEPAWMQRLKRARPV